MADAKFLEKLFDKQKIIIQILVDKGTNEIVELISYGLDKAARSYYKHLVCDNDELSEKIIIETLYPFYNYKQDSRDCGFAPIDIDSDDQNVRCKWKVIWELNEAKETLGTQYRYEFYVSKRVGDFKNFGGPLELKFIREWLIANGHQIPEI